MRTGYCLNEYRHKIGLSGTPLCECGGTETREHYVEDCPEYTDVREELRVRLMQHTGINDWSLDLFLAIKPKDDYQEERLVIRDIFYEFLERTDRLLKLS